MRGLKRYLLCLIIFCCIILFLPQEVLAFCPVCVAATGTGMGFFRWLGVDDTIIGLWLGGFIISILIWLSRKFKLRLPVVVIGSYSLGIAFFYRVGIFGYPFNKLWGINKLIFGVTVGSLILLFAPLLDKFLRSKNNGRIFISHQKVIISAFLLSIFSLILYFATKYG